MTYDFSQTFHSLVDIKSYQKSVVGNKLFILDIKIIEG